MPIYKELKILDSGRLGRVNLITMNFGSFKEYNMKNRFFNRNSQAARCLISAYTHSPSSAGSSTPSRISFSPGKALPDRCGRAGRPPSHQSGRTDGKCDALSPLHSKQPKRGMVSVRTDLSRSWSTRVPGKQNHRRFHRRIRNHQSR